MRSCAVAPSRSYHAAGAKRKMPGVRGQRPRSFPGVDSKSIGKPDEPDFRNACAGAGRVSRLTSFMDHVLSEAVFADGLISSLHHPGARGIITAVRAHRVSCSHP